MRERLQAKGEPAVQRAGQPPEKRKFKPHVTLARFKSHPGGRLESYFAVRSLFRAPPFEVADFTLFSSYLAHEGAIYSPEAVYPLRTDRRLDRRRYRGDRPAARSEEHTSELQSLLRISYAVFCLKKKKPTNPNS